MASWRAEPGLYWKNTCQVPSTRHSPLGSLSQPRAGRGWVRGKARLMGRTAEAVLGERVICCFLR